MINHYIAHIGSLRTDRNKNKLFSVSLCTVQTVGTDKPFVTVRLSAQTNKTQTTKPLASHHLR